MTTLKVHFNEYGQAFEYDTRYCVYDAGTTDNLPDWWPNPDLNLSEISGIQNAGCAGYAYCPVIYYNRAFEHMKTYGDDVLDYLESVYDEIPAPPKGTCWWGMSNYYLSLAVEHFISLYDVEKMIEILKQAKDKDSA